MPINDRMKIRRVKPLLHDDEEEEEDLEVENEDVDMSDASGSGSDGSEEEDDEEAGDEDEEEDESATARASISRISFGTLARAQSSLLKEKKAPVKSRARTGAPAVHAPDSDTYFDGSKKVQDRKDNPARASKNAPQEITSKRTITRKRIVVEPAAAKMKSRDPRFDTAVNGVFADHEFRRNYAFLDDYRNDEMKLLKEQIRKVKDKDERKKEALEKKLRSMESQKQSQQNKDKSAEALKRHKTKERELVKQGKTPFHLKQSEIKKLVLQEEFSKLSEKQVERVVARKQKRKAQKERKHMPWERRET
ncbi:rRNA biogenesis protein RRP36 [Tricharina praecox]|uniref:rRNA biogenesis protein RRP36 n=1 Tax=Tricharina praecox TaxID=43433 RepID=UPI00222073D5|nr:rRNA biogenesis protein RRP36 [Tricharina praecox]KAI5854825.1 rRNA biogenesis protein RRP36 [Tricharina praecox]